MHPRTMAPVSNNFQSPIVEGVGSSQVPCADFPADAGGGHEVKWQATPTITVREGIGNQKNPEKSRVKS